MRHTRIEIAEWLGPVEGILEALNEGVVIVDNELHVVFANEALLRLGNFKREEIEGMRPDAIFPAKDIPQILRHHESGHRHGRSRIEFYVPGRNGDRIPAIFSGRSIHAPDGEEYVLLIVTDISTQKHVEEQLRESNTLLEKRQTEIEAGKQQKTKT
jgi:PAS domain S-box-containing protein